MAPKTEPDPPPEQTDEEKAAEQQRESFFAEIEARVSKVIDTKIADARKNAKTGTARTGRTTLPGIFADLFFPEPK